jgi:pyruvate/2-oxoglutarate/acetoin dehydrogenase E1 component
VTHVVSYARAINEALHQEMARDERVFVFGLDVADHKGINGTTLGLAERFGSERCFSTPVSEDAMTGVALGAALNGLRPVHVHIRVDFLLLAMNQIANMITTTRYMTGGEVGVPLVIRAIVGRGWGQSAQHSKALQSVFAHLPGLKVVMPTSPNDAKGLLVSAIRDDNPVIFLEHRWLNDVSGETEVESAGIPLGSARTLRAGRDATVVATSWMVVEALRASEILCERGVELEVIDPRTIVPLDVDCITASVERTGHCVVADNDWTFCGFGAEVAATVAERCFDALLRPVIRIGWPSVPCPTARNLEDHFYPSAREIVRAVESQLDLEPANLDGVDFYSYENRFRGPF